jgi:hypothetical protein
MDTLIDTSERTSVEWASYTIVADLFADVSVATCHGASLH